jgi:curved DNA-binding protein CbpA
VSQIPETIPEIGSASQQPRKNPLFDPAQYRDLTSEDYFVWTRIDGATSIRQIILETGFSATRAIAILRRLRLSGAFLMPGEEPQTPPERPIGGPAPSAQGTIRPGAPVKIPQPLLDLTPEERAALAEQVDLSEEDKRAVIRVLRKVERGTFFDLLGVDENTDRRTLKREYFKLSKQFHPDRYYGKNTGSFGPWLSRIFEAVSRAYAVLDDPNKRAEYQGRLSVAAGRPAVRRSQTHEEHAAELFERGCAFEVAGNYVEALKLFAAVTRIDTKPQYIRRAARCALQARELSLAEEYAKKAAGLAPTDPSSARLLATVLRAVGKLREAEATLERALSLSPGNDILLRELEADLRQVRDELSVRR